MRLTTSALLKLCLILWISAVDITNADDGSASTKREKVKVFILSGQSNMVGAGKVTGGSSRWGAEFINPVVSVYEGEYQPDANYDALKPITSLALENFGGSKPTSYPGGGTQVDARVCSSRGLWHLPISPRLRWLHAQRHGS